MWRPIHPSHIRVGAYGWPISMSHRCVPASRRARLQAGAEKISYSVGKKDTVQNGRISAKMIVRDPLRTWLEGGGVYGA